MEEERCGRQNKRKLGKQYEGVAEAYLLKKGYEILEKNYQVRMGEIDLIARKDNYVVAFEVKYRSSDRYGLPSVAVTREKQGHISRAFAYYIMSKNLSFDLPYRFDVLGITGDGRIQHIENAFEYVN